MIKELLLKGRLINTRSYALPEEVANTLVHGFGLVLSILGFVVLVMIAVNAGDPWNTVSFSIYGASLILMYLSSTLFHAMLADGVNMHHLKVCDHCAIYLLIAGTYTVFTLGPLRGPWGWTLLGVVWGLGFAGVVFKVMFGGRFRPLSLAVYLGMGWIILIAIVPLAEVLPAGGIALLFAGGLAYSLGVIFYVYEGIPYNHAIWHVFVLMGSICHFIAVLLYVA